MRKCKAKYWQRSDNRKSGCWIEIEGYFHQWAPAYEEFENGPGNFTEAIVEDLTGQVWSCAVESVNFIKD